MKIKKELWLIIPFIFTTFSIGLLNLVEKDRESSPVENRLLQQSPGIEDIKNKEYTSIFETYYTDQFIGRDSLLKLYAKYERATNHSTVRNHYIINDEWILSKKEAKLDEESLQKHADILNYFSISPTDSGKKVYYVSSPCKSQALDHLYPSYAETNYVLDNLERFEKKLDKKYITFINIDKYFKENIPDSQKEKMYFKTDHHWNITGAFEGFKYIINSMNILEEEQQYLLDNDNYTFEIDKNKNVMGSYNSNTFNMLSPKDDVPYIYPKYTTNFEFFKYIEGEYKQVDMNEIVATGRNNDQLTYSQAYNPDHSLYKIINKNAPIDKKILIIKDSYQSATTLMFANLFKTVEIFDPRIDTNIYPSDIIKDDETDIIVYMFNSSTFTSMVDRLI